MRLQRVPEPAGYGFTARCLGCKQMIPAGTAKIADLDGPAFQAYYHTTCVPEGTEVPVQTEVHVHDHDHH